ncbi:organic solute transporter subunit alpha-like isoform X2 [Tachyglossus aculeatus]|uniref:organic solute transporter subunit alpha-like isoform X2 n=1 Tax=Tachyglossus aculeatus TaxID=9261 RepID=UPI0018F34EDA|nr:organic solute transporter subunit alpha-like isoform X2 [Tachyglossus aculeatus]
MATAMMVKANCSGAPAQFPLSWEIFQVLALLQVGLFLEAVGFFLRGPLPAHRTGLCLWILGVYPVIGVTAAVGIYVPRSSFVCNFVASLYHSITLWKFLELVRDLAGGEARLLRQLHGSHVAPNPPPCCCCCCCCPNIAITRTSLRWMSLAVLQLSLVRTALFLVSLVLWTDEQYDYGDVGSSNPNSYFNALMGASTFLSFYGYLLFYTASRRALPGFRLRAKFICITLVLVVCGLQSGVLETMGALGVIPCSPPFSARTRSQIIYYYSLTVEMFGIGLLARSCFRRLEPAPREGKPQEEEGEARTEEVGSGSPWHTWASPKPESRPQRESLGVAGDTWAPNPTFQLGEEGLCHIEHTPLPQAGGPGSPAGSLTLGTLPTTVPSPLPAPHPPAPTSPGALETRA